MSISILTIGDELIIGQVQDTNSSWIAKEINNVGLEVKKIISISDSENDIINTLNLCLKESNIIITTGGLGPTHDDLTKKVLCKFFNDSLVKNEKILDHIIKLFKKRNKVPNELNFHQAYLPKKCKVILNKIGTASFGNGDVDSAPEPPTIMITLFLLCIFSIIFRASFSYFPILYEFDILIFWIKWCLTSFLK